LAISAPPVATKPIPHLPSVPLIGALDVFRMEQLAFYRHLAQVCGDVGGFSVGLADFIVFNTSELAHAVLVEHAADFDKGEVVRRAFRPAIGNGLFINEGASWRRQRKLMAPSFQPRHIASYAETMVGYAERAQAEWIEGEVLEIDHEMMRVTMSIVGKVLFDADVFTEADELGAAVRTALGYVSTVLNSPISFPLEWSLPGHRRVREAVAFIRARLLQMIDERRAHPENVRDDFLSVLLRARDEDDGSGMSDEQLVDEAVTLFGAGHETTSMALTWAWYLLATHPDIYSRMQREVDEVLQGRAPAYADLARLPYTLQVLKESMRLYPPAFMVGRAALRDVVIDGYPIRRGQFVLISTYTMQRRADYFPDPEHFDPDHFAPEHERELPRYAYIPFGAGPRICIGNHFALMEGHLLLATLAQRVRFELVPGQDVTPIVRVTMRPKQPMRMAVHRRGDRPVAD
jgi:cytochrome P450